MSAGGLEALSEKMSTRYLQIGRASLARAIRYAEAHDLVGRNVATLVDSPKGQIGRPSRSFTLAESLALLEAARESRLNAYVVLSLATGIRTEEARELHWDHVDLDGETECGAAGPPSVAVWHSVRQGGDTKTAKSRRTLALPQAAVQALREHRKRQAEDRLAAGASVAGSRTGLRLGYRHTAGRGECPARVPQDHRGCWPRRRVGATRSAPHFRLLDVRRRRAHRGDRSPGGPQPHRYNRTRL